MSYASPRLFGKLPERLFKHYVETDPVGSKSINFWLESFYDDTDKIIHLAKTVTEIGVRVQAIKRLEDRLDEEDIFSLYEDAVKDAPEERFVYDNYARYLIKTKRFSRARDILLGWLDLNLPEAGLGRTVMRNSIANSYLEEGLYEKGLEYIESYVSGMQSQTIVVSAQLLHKLAKEEEAEERFLMALRRYPDSVYCLAAYVEFLWDTGRYEDASLELSRFSYPLGWMDWKFKIGKKFSNVFGDRNPEEAIRAFQFLIASKFSPLKVLIYFSDKLNQDGHSELAYKLNSMLTFPGFGNLELVFRSYKYLKEWQGEEKAFEWLKNKIPAPLLGPAVMFIFQSNDYDLMWSLIIKPDKKDEDFTWLMRVAGWIKWGREEQYKQRLMRYYQNHKKTAYDKIARYLLDLEPLEVLLKLMDGNPKKLCEASYYIGLKAQADGDYHKASDWYHVSYATGLTGNGEYRWALNQLYEWYSKGRCLNCMVE